MNLGRVAVIVTCAVVAGLGVWFALARWEDANKVAAMASALGAIAAVGVAVWAAVKAPGAGGSVRLSDTGKATAGPGGSANTGVRGVRGNVRVKRTGDAQATNGDANTGIEA